MISLWLKDKAEESDSTESPNISKLKEISDKLFYDHYRFEVAFDGLDVGVLLIDYQGEILHANRFVCNLLQYMEQEIRYMGWHVLTHPDDLDMDHDLAVAVSEGRINGYKIVKRYRHRMGHWVWIVLTVRSVIVRGELLAVCTVQDLETVRSIEPYPHVVSIENKEAI